STPAKTTLFAGRQIWLRALPLRKFPGGIFANEQTERPYSVKSARGGVSSQGCIISLSGTDADDAINVRDEDLAVTHLARLGGLEDGLDDLIRQVAADS